MTGGGRAGPWPGHGPFSHLAPWERPGWVYGRGACWRFFDPGPQGQYGRPPAAPPGYPQPFREPTREEEERMLKEELAELESRVEEIKKRLGEPGR